MVARTAENLRSPGVDVAKAPVRILHDERVGDALEDPARESLGALRCRASLLRLRRGFLQLLVALLEILSERLCFLRLRFELEGLLLQCAVEDVELVRPRLGLGARRGLRRIAHRLLLGSAPLGQIARDLGETNDLAARVAQRRDDHVRPEASAVLAKAPSFVFEPAIARRMHQLVGGLSRFDVSRWIEDREVASDDLVRLVALELVRTDVPGQDVAVSVESEDGIVADAGDEQSIQLGRFVCMLPASRARRIVSLSRRFHRSNTPCLPSRGVESSKLVVGRKDIWRDTRTMIEARGMRRQSAETAWQRRKPNDILGR